MSRNRVLGTALLALLLSFEAVVAAPPSRAEDPITLRPVGHGTVVGYTDPVTGNHGWLGVPYAQPPVGDLRWRAPKPAPNWRGVREALRVAPACSQPARPGSGASAEITGSEDCLYLNIYTPIGAKSRAPARLPVMVWIHGGANLRGNGGDYDGGVLAARHNVVVVTFNYRLGILGWFSHPALRATAGDAEAASGNFGTLDQIMALRWVRKNIAGFGGDPDRVTLFGESAGGQNVFALLTAPGAAGLFQRALVQSGSTATSDAGETSGPDKPLGPAAITDQLWRNTEGSRRGVHFREELARHSCADVSRFLRSRSVAELQRAIDQLSEESGSALRALPALFNDGTVLPADGIRAALNNGRFHRVPVLLGSTRDEFTILLPMFAAQTGLVDIDPATSRLAIPDRNHFLLAAEYLAKLLKAVAVDEPARLMRASGHSAVFAYRFDWDQLAPAPWLEDIRLGATHGLDVPFVFGHRALGDEYVQVPLIRAGSDASFRTLSAAMMSYWAGFAADGSPGRGRDRLWPEWEPWSTNGGKEGFMVLDDPAHGGLRMSRATVSTEAVLAELAADPRLPTLRERCNLWRELVSIGKRTGLRLGKRPGLAECCEPVTESVGTGDLDAGPENLLRFGSCRQATVAAPHQEG